MIRGKSPSADLKHSYRKVLWRSAALSALFHLLLFATIPPIEFAPRMAREQMIVITLEHIPETRQQLPPPPTLPEPVTVHDAGEKPSPDYRPPAVLPEEEEEKIAFEEEEEAVEFWMLEKNPRAIKRVMPTYPDSARKALIEGKVTVRALLDGEGKVERIDRIEGPFVFHQATATAFRQWEFTPAVQNDRTVKVWISLPFVFELE